ncbi:glycosyltransferase [Zobellia galactanivorans]|uniref:glycosyltransferase n=1 Tax=Zobellia TaxID=112040 RepID=UPI000B52B1E0|nr:MULTISPECIES: glycosyltransferase [Zobellia]MDO6807518.1 glycosyltransferase [Zobellia galactanivorans]OWW24227.1 hypothetical protein B4Q04_17285 [Zobellia sp. OII3]
MNPNFKKKTVVFIIPSLSPGGAERVFCFLSQNLSLEKFNTELIVIGSAKDTSYAVENVPITYLNKNRVRQAIPQLFSLLAKKKPDFVLSSIAHLNVIMGLFSYLFSNINFIIRPSNIENENENFISQYYYRGIYKIVCQSHDMANNFRKKYKVARNKIIIIGNPITNFEHIQPKESYRTPKKFITVGRLNKIKGHSRIISILSKLQADFHYTLVGDGPELNELFRLAETLQIRDKITHIPFTKNVNMHLKESDLFLQGSYSEGFPNAALESCSVGVPVLAFDVPGGTKEIIDNYKNGFLAKTEEDFLNFIKSKTKWNNLSVQSTVANKFSSKNILKKYEQLLSS